MGEDLGVGQRCRARETSTSDAVACPLFSIRDVEMYDSVCLDPPLPFFHDPVSLLHSPS